MHAEHTTATATELFDELSALAAGGGVLTFVLGPLALPMLSLVAVVVIAVVLAAVTAGLVVALLTAPALVALRLTRRRRTRAAPYAPAQPASEKTRTPPHKRAEGTPNMSDSLTVEAQAHVPADASTVWAPLEDVNR